MQPFLLTLFKRFPGVRYWPVWFMVGVLRLLAWLPLPLLYVLGAVGGELAYLLHRPRRNITLRNLTACFPDKTNAEIRALARGHFRSLVVAVLNTGVSWWGGEARLRRMTRFQNRAVLDAAKRRGENVIVLVPHFTGLEYGGMFLSIITPTITMYQHHKNPLMDALIKQHRARFGGILYPRRAPAKSMIKLLRQGHLFYYLPDQDPGRNKGVFAPFFSIPTATYGTLGRIARLINATVIPCAVKILPWGRGFEIIFEQPLSDYPGGDTVADATRMNHAIEALIAHAPEQYFWSHRRFKTRPPGERPFYS